MTHHHHPEILFFFKQVGSNIPRATLNSLCNQGWSWTFVPPASTSQVTELPPLPCHLEILDYERNSYFWTCALCWQSSGTVEHSVRRRRHTQCAFSPLLPSARGSHCLLQGRSQKGNAGPQFAFRSHSVWETIPETCADHINGQFTQLTLKVYSSHSDL